jgi:hypothetical protein
VKINIDSFSTVYEGDIIDCNITGNPTLKYWKINDYPLHTTFYNENPVIYNPDPAPLDEEYVNLTVYVENTAGSDSDTVQVNIKRLFFGDIHFHSTISDGFYRIDTLYQNAIKDNYLDFACLTDHAEIVNGLDHTPPQEIWMFLRSFTQFILYKIGLRDEWSMIKNKAIEYHDPGNFTTFLGFEYSAGPWYPGGWPWSENGHEDISHINFYYRDIYPDAQEYSAWQMHTFDDILKAMEKENDMGHLNIGFPHHPLMKIRNWGAYTVNWTFFANNIEEKDARNKIIRGAEVYSKWGTAIGKYSDIPILWPYNSIYLKDHQNYWVENGLWEWSKNNMKNQKFVLMASSDTHSIDRPGSASMKSRFSSAHISPSGLIAAYSTHNTREEIWDAMNDCDIYGVQTLKIRANARFEGEMALGRWINCTTPLNIQITAQSTFPGTDRSGKNMYPHEYSPDELDYPISDIWIVKKDTERGQPWCKVINHTTPNTSLAVVNFEDYDVEPGDFYYIAILQKGQDLGKIISLKEESKDEYMAFIGPIFIDNIEE